MDWVVDKILEYPRRSAAIILAGLLAIGGFLWWQMVWQNPYRVFDDMLANNLAASSVTKSIKAGSGDNGIDQTVSLRMGSVNASEWLVAARQNGARVTTDSIGTPTTGYIRYTDISTAGKKTATFSGVLNQWGKSDGKTDTNLNGLFSQSLLDITGAPTPPIGNLPVAQRENLLAFIRGEKVFTPDFSKVKHQAIGGRGVYTYSVTVKLVAYVRLMQAFARDLGLKSLDAVDPNQYAGLAPITFTMSVDPFSHQLVQTAYANTGFVQAYADWGLQSPITLPSHTISTTELQRRLQAVGKT